MKPAHRSAAAGLNLSRTRKNRIARTLAPSPARMKISGRAMPAARLVMAVLVAAMAIVAIEAPT